jgi:hypothetical protein
MSLARSARSVATLHLPLVLLVTALLGMPSVVQDLGVHYDEAVHLVVAKSLAEGHGYVQDSLPGSPSHPKYPPVVSLLLAAVWRLGPAFPASLVVMRALMLAGSVATVWLTYRVARRLLGAAPFDALVLAALTGWHPLFIGYSTLTSSELLYALVALASLLGYGRAVALGGRAPLVVAVGLAILAFFTRTVGIALLLALIIDLLRRRRPAAAGAASLVTAAAAGFWQVWGQFAQQAYRGYPPEVGINYVTYAGQVLLSPWAQELNTLLRVNAASLVGAWAHFIAPWALDVSSPIPPTALACLIALPVLAHRVWRVSREGPSVVDLYVAIYLPFVLFWPWPFSERFLISVSPFLVWYALEAARAAAAAAWRGSASLSPDRVWHGIAGLLVVAVLLSSLGTAWLRWETRIRRAEIQGQFQRMLTWLARSTPPDAVLVGPYDPLYYLVTGRRAVRLAYPDPFAIYYVERPDLSFPQAARLLDWFRSVGACYVIQDPAIVEPRQVLYFFELIRAMRVAARGSLETVYRDGQWFAVHRILDCPGDRR